MTHIDTQNRDGAPVKRTTRYSVATDPGENREPPKSEAPAPVLAEPKAEITTEELKQ